MELFETRCKLTPHLIALSYKNESLTYATLNAKANQLGYYLLSNKVKAKDPVAVCLKNSLELIISLLGILKIGALYLPLSPSYPINHLKFLLNDAKAKFLIVDNNLKTKFAEYSDISLEGGCFLQNTIKSYPLLNCDYKPSLNDSAYIIYTSGSTGLPKGVVGNFLGMSNLLSWTKKNYAMTSKDSFLLTASIGFSISLWQLLLPLVCGAKLVLVDNNKNHNIYYLANTIEEKKITTIHLVPTMLKKLLTTYAIKKCESLKWIATGGDIVSPDLLELSRKKLKAKLYISYGTSETSTIIASYSASNLRLRDIRDKFRDKYCIGKPIANTQIYLFDENMHQVFGNKIGEIYIGGYSLANGYLNLSNLTQEKFVFNPLASKDNIKLYSTGDLARYLSNGYLEFIGRKDFQIKINGCRIEPEGIENILRKHPVINDAVVVKRKIKLDSNLNEISIAWIVPYNLSILNLNSLGKNNLKKQIKKHLYQYLPSYEMPKMITFIRQLPTNINGKIDRKVLLTKPIL